MAPELLLSRKPPGPALQPALGAKKNPQRADRAAARLRSVSQPPLAPKVIEIPPAIPVLSGPNPRTYVLLWVRCCVGSDEDGDAASRG